MAKMKVPALNGPVVIYVLRAVQLLLAIIVLGLSGYVAHWWHSHWNALPPGPVSFLVFASVWTLLALAYQVFVPRYFLNTVLHHRLSVFVVEAVTMIFWFAGFLALAVFLSDRVCFGTVCNAARAAAVFAAFEWAVFVVATAIATWHTFSKRERSIGEKQASTMPMQEGV